MGGFSFKGSTEKNNLLKFIQEIKKIKNFLKVLHIHTANFQNVTLKDFEKFLKIAIDMSEINFEEFSLQCANWTFASGQPKSTELQQALETFTKNAYSTIKNKKFRLEMSGWYYTEREALNFLNPNNS